jgi:hypothetical protein
MICRNMKTTKGVLLGLMLIAVALPAAAQLPTPNEAGVSAGHHIFVVKDLEATNKFWAALGAEPAQLGNLKLLKFPGVLFLARQGNSAGGTEGSTIEYLGFKVKNIKESLSKWQAAGIKPMPGGTATEVFLMGPDDIKYRITEDASLATSIASDAVKMNVPNPAAAQAWYAKYFGGPSIPGASVQFAQAKGTPAGTKGRALDRLGFEVKNLEQIVQKLQNSGAKLDGPIRKASGMALAVAVLTDPWGTYIELSEGLAAVK